MKQTLLICALLFSGWAWGQAQSLTLEQVDGFVDRHNFWRQEVGTAPLSWSPELAQYAQEWAIRLSKNGCRLRHRPNNDYGENIYWSSSQYTNPVDAVASWASEKSVYRGQKISNSNYHRFGHYTQMIWKNTTEVGCASALCNRGRGVMVVCNYNPPGNYIGQHPYR